MVNKHPPVKDQTETETLYLLRQAGIERDDLGSRLARYEYQAMKSELEGGQALSFQIEISQDNDHSHGITPPEFLLSEDDMDRLPVLPTPLGRIAWSKHPESLKVTGVLIEDLDPEMIANPLLSLLTEHHRNPFARLLFLCRSLTPIPLLGRYGFLCHFLPQTPIQEIGPVMEKRHGMSQIRGLLDGAKLWQAA